MLSGVYFVLPAVLVLMASFLIVRAGAIALMMTGLDEETAKFQALSAFTMTGFTTKEAELIVNHPQRRQIISWLMRLGSAGIVIVIVTATTSLMKSTGFDIPISLVILGVGVFTAYRLINHSGIAWKWESFIRQRLARSRVFHIAAMENLLRLRGGFGVVRVFMVPDSPFIGHSIKALGFKGADFSVLGVERDHERVPYQWFLLQCGADGPAVPGKRLPAQANLNRALIIATGLS